MIFFFCTRMGLVLHGACSGMGCHHHHSHHGHLERRTERSKPKNINVRAAVIHVLGDLIQSVGVLVSAFIIKFYVRLSHGSMCVYCVKVYLSHYISFLLFCDHMVKIIVVSLPYSLGVHYLQKNVLLLTESFLGY